MQFFLGVLVLQLLLLQQAAALGVADLASLFARSYSHVSRTGSVSSNSSATSRSDVQPSVVYAVSVNSSNPLSSSNCSWSGAPCAWVPSATPAAVEAGSYKVVYPVEDAVTRVPESSPSTATSQARMAEPLRYFSDVYQHPAEDRFNPRPHLFTYKKEPSDPYSRPSSYQAPTIPDKGPSPQVPYNPNYNPPQDSGYDFSYPPYPPNDDGPPNGDKPKPQDSYLPPTDDTSYQYNPPVPMKDDKDKNKGKPSDSYLPANDDSDYNPLPSVKDKPSPQDSYYPQGDEDSEYHYTPEHKPKEKPQNSYYPPPDDSGYPYGAPHPPKEQKPKDKPMSHHSGYAYGPPQDDSDEDDAQPPDEDSSYEDHHHHDDKPKYHPPKDADILQPPAKGNRPYSKPKPQPVYSPDDDFSHYHPHHQDEDENDNHKPAKHPHYEEDDEEEGDDDTPPMKRPKHPLPPEPRPPPPHVYSDEDLKHQHYDEEYYEDHHGPHTTPMPMDDTRVDKGPYSYYNLGRKLWYIPLYFAVYFIIYVTALILKSVARHKINYPHYHHDKKSDRRSLTEITNTVSEHLEAAQKRFM